QGGEELAAAAGQDDQQVDVPAPDVAASTAEPPADLSEDEGMEIVGNAIKDLRRGEPKGDVRIQASSAPSDDFIPAQTETSGELALDEAFDPEQSAADAYRHRKALSAEEIAAVRAEAEEAGYLEGFKLGEEKGEIQV